MGKVTVKDSSDVVGKVKTPKRASKDHNAPKRARSAYIFFSTAVTKKIREANPSWTQTEVMREAAQRWKELSDKSKYEDQAVLDRERYQNDMSSYVPDPHSEASSSTGKKVKKPKDPNAPKKPRSAYLVFSMEEGKRLRQELPKLPPTEVMKKVSENWKNLDEDERRPFEVRAAEDKERYQREITAYEQGIIEP